MIPHRMETVFLFVGDVIFLYVALTITLLLRYGSSSFDFLRMSRLHFPAFSLIFILWIFVFFIAGLYEKHTLFLQKQLPQLLSRALLVNALIAIAFFYFLPAFQITPKVNLFICLFLSSVLIFFWRRYRLQTAAGGERRERAIIIGSGKEMQDIIREINHNPRFEMRFEEAVDTARSPALDAETIIRRIEETDATLVVADFHDPKIQSVLPH